MDKANECPSAIEPAHCVRCKSLAQELLTKADLNEEERAEVKSMLLHLRGENALDDESRETLNNLAARHLE